MRYILLIILMLFIGNMQVDAATISDVENLLNKTESVINEQSQYEVLDKRYPVGSIYISTSSTNPSSLFGGTWERYAGGRKLVATGDNGTTNYTSVNATGGNKAVTLSSSNLPAHTHSITPSGTVTSSFIGKSATTSSNGAHTHTLPFGLASSEAKGFGLRTTIYDGKDGGSYYDRALITTSSPNYGTRIANTGAHTHSATPSGSVTSTFTGKTVTSSSNGSGSSIDIMNPYITVYIWRRTA